MLLSDNEIVLVLMAAERQEKAQKEALVNVSKKVAAGDSNPIVVNRHRSLPGLIKETHLLILHLNRSHDLAYIDAIGAMRSLGYLANHAPATISVSTIRGLINKISLWCQAELKRRP